MVWCAGDCWQTWELCGNLDNMPNSPPPHQVSSGVCPSCDGAEFRVLRMPDRGLTVNICAACGLYINANPHPAEEAVAEGVYDRAYHADFYQSTTARKRRTGGFRLRLVETLVEPGAFLDIGCSLGYLVEAAAQRGWDAYGIDISEDAVKLCRGRRLQVTIGDMQHLDFPDEEFDVIYLRHVLEHDIELRACLAEIKRVLKAQGLLVIEVPCVDCWQVRHKRENYRKFWHTCHCYWFSRKSLRNVLRRAGYHEVPLPRYGKKALTGGLGPIMQYLTWRTHILVKRGLGLAPYDVSAWRKNGGD